MSPKTPRKTTDDKLAELALLYQESDESLLQSEAKKALRDRSNRVVAKAAELCEEKLLYDSEDDLLQAYQRLLENPVKQDPNCMGKKAVLRALVALDYNDVSFYQQALHYVQREPVWGGSIDTAIDVRCSAAMGLVSTSYSRALLELIDLLNDEEIHARIGAIRAIAYGSRYEAALLLRQKLATDDAETEVIGECFIALLQVEPEESLPLVTAQLTDQDDEALYEMAALALGESRLEGALHALQRAWNQSFAYQKAIRRILLRAISLHRSEEAFAWLLELIEDTTNEKLTDEIVELLAIYKHNRKLKKDLAEVLDIQGTEGNRECFRKWWD